MSAGLNWETVIPIDGSCVHPSIRLWTTPNTFQMVPVGSLQVQPCFKWDIAKESLAYSPSLESCSQCSCMKDLSSDFYFSSFSNMPSSRKPFGVALAQIDVCQFNSHYEMHSLFLHSSCLHCLVPFSCALILLLKQIVSYLKGETRNQLDWIIEINKSIFSACY